jgi:hypothetical protein
MEEGGDGIMESWNGGMMGGAAYALPNIPVFHCSIFPVLLSPFRWWAALPGFPPTQGLPEIFRSNGTDGSEADTPREEKGTTRHCPEPPLLFVVFGGYWMHRNGGSAIMVVVRSR